MGQDNQEDLVFFVAIAFLSREDIGEEFCLKMNAKKSMQEKYGLIKCEYCGCES